MRKTYLKNGKVLKVKGRRYKKQSGKMLLFARLVQISEFFNKNNFTKKDRKLLIRLQNESDAIMEVLNDNTNLGDC